MNKRVKIFALSAAVLVAGVIGTSAVSTNVSADSNKKISSERAQQLALTAVQGKVTSVDLEHDDGITYYDFDIVKNKQEYDVHIDAYTGKTLKVKLDDDKKTVQQQKQTNTNTTTNNTASKEMITAKEAATVAANHVKGKVQSTEKDTDDGIHLYEVELTTNRGEVEVDVDAYSGKILSVDYDDNDNDDDHDDDDDDDDQD